MASSTPNGVLIIDKPKGPTSHDVVARVRKLLKTRAVGHAGTLDPMATGVLVVAVGEGTKLVPWLTAADKAYAATIRLGIATDTLDAEGTATETRDVPTELVAWARAGVSQDASHGADASGVGAPGASRVAGAPALVAAAFAAESARVEQVPPIFSAIKIDGVRAHALARAGEDVELAPRSVAVKRLALVAARVEGDAVFLDIEVESAKGYFVRSLARDLAAGLGTVGHLTSLRRVKSGAFYIEDAVALESLTPAALMSVDAAAAKALPSTTLRDAATVLAATQGKRIPRDQFSAEHAGPAAWFDPDGHLVAVGESTDGIGRVLRGFPRAP